MVERRNVIGGGLLAGAAGLLAHPEPAAAAQQGADGLLVAEAVNRLREALTQLAERDQDPCRLGPCRATEAIRGQQRMFLRANQKYPDFIEVGLAIWDELYDWHIKQRQPVMAARLADGRYAMTYMFTTVILRPDAQLDYVGFAFDADARRP